MENNEVLGRLFLLQGISPQDAARLLGQIKPQRRVYRRGEELCTPQCFERALYVLLRGECDVLQGAGETRVTLNTLRAGDCFGVASLFSRRDAYPSTVTARRETEVLVLPRAEVERLMQLCPQVSMNLIAFLTDRVEFLNQKVASLTEPTVERRLAGWLLSARTEDDMPIAMNRKHTAEMLGCGRASLYRALERLQAKGFIALDGNLIRLTSQEGLERV